MVTAGLLGAKRGAIATFIGLLIYAIMFGKIFGPTIGYIVAMPIAAYLIGIVHERTEIFGLRFITMILAGIYLIYLIGVPVLKVMTGLDWKTSFSVGVIPFLLGDFIKVLFASIITQKSKHLAIV
jgi:biotin transport system substrate-specific component